MIGGFMMIAQSIRFTPMTSCTKNLTQTQYIQHNTNLQLPQSFRVVKPQWAKSVVSTHKQVFACNPCYYTD